MARFIGRAAELAEFRRLLEKKTSSLIVCHGRRRVGKSAFFRECSRSTDHFLFFEGLPPREGLRQEHQLEAFAERLAAQTKAPKLKIESWPQAFQLLASVLPASGKTLLLLDEISWMGLGEPDFAGHLKTAWDNWFSPRPNLLVVLCGSVSSWIQENILNNTGFVGRCSWQLHLPPLPLPDCALFWGNRQVSAAEKLKILAVTGGVPRYLEEVSVTQSAEQNIARLCFSSGGLLFREFDQIFHDIFSRRAETYRQVVTTLVSGAKTTSEISEALKQERGGTLSAAVGDLESAGFLRRDVSFDPDTGDVQPRAIKFRIGDNYLRFFLKYIKPVQSRIEKGLYRHAPLETLQAWDTIMGLQFESLILDNLPALFAATGLINIPILNAGPFFRSKTQRRPGCQVDLMLRTKQAVYLFEAKFRRTIDKSVIAEVKEKVARLGVSPGLTVRTGLIYQGDLHSEIPKADYFDHIVSFDDLLRMM